MVRTRSPVQSRATAQVSNSTAFLRQKFWRREAPHKGGWDFRALRAREGGSENSDPKILEEGFKGGLQSLCVFAPPTRAHTSITAVFAKYYKTAMIAPVKSAIL